MRQASGCLRTRTYANEWAAVHNPYADTAAGQQPYDWFRFDASGFLVTGWYQDTDGNFYYLSPVSDGTMGRMVTGWNEIDGQQFYFEEESNGIRGALKRDVSAAGRETDGEKKN
jgi:glucan-binding YG repeat protein